MCWYGVRVSSVMEKSWNSGKGQNNFPDLEKSWNLKRRQKSWNFKMHHGKIMEFWNFLACYFWDFSHATCAIGHCHSDRSWKMQRESWKNHGISFWEMAGNPVWCIMKPIDGDAAAGCGLPHQPLDLDQRPMQGSVTVHAWFCVALSFFIIGLF